MFLLYEYDIFWAFLIIASAIPILAFLISGVLALICKGPEKLSSYESGIEPMGDAWLQFRIRYYMFALVFVVFYVETKKTNPIHNDVPENTTFLLFDQPSGEANTTCTLISKIAEVAINAKTANWKAIVIFLILQSINKRNYIPFDPFIGIGQKIVSAKNSNKTYHRGILPRIY